MRFLFLSFLCFNTRLFTRSGAGEFCVEVQKCDSSGNVCVLFPTTSAGASAVPIPDENSGCFHNHSPPIMKCLEDATWEQTEIICDEEPTSVTMNLTRIIKDDVNDAHIKSSIEFLTTHQSPISSYDVRLMSELTCRVKMPSQNPIADIIRINPETIASSQNLFNSSDKALDCLNLQIENCKNISSKQFVDGQMALSTISPHDKFFKVSLSENISAEHQVNDIVEEFLSNPNITIIVSLADFSRSNNVLAVGFFTNSMFAEQDGKSTLLISDIIGVAVSSEDKDGDVDFDVYFKEIESSENPDKVCGFWNYGVDEDLIPVYGRWVIDSTAEALENDIYKCKYTRDGYFAIGVRDDAADSCTTTTSISSSSSSKPTTSTARTTTTPTTTTAPISSSTQTTATTNYKLPMESMSSTTLCTTSSQTTPAPEIVCPVDQNCDSLECFTFPETPAGSYATPIPGNSTYCFDSDYYPPRRLCFDNGTWDNFEADCDDEIEPTGVTKILTEKASETTSDDDKLLTVYMVANSNQKITSYDVYLMSQLVNLEREEGFTVLQAKFDAISNMTTIDRKILKDSQLVFNSTDAILDNFNQNLKTFELYPPNKYLRKSIGVSAFSPFIDIFQFLNDLTIDFLSGNIDIALENFTQNQNSDVLVSIRDYTNITEICVTVFSDDSLFNEDTITQINSRIVSFLSVGEPSPSGTFDIYFKQTNRVDLEQTCASYKFMSDVNSKPISGKWVFESNSIDLENGVFKCTFNSFENYFALSSIQPPPNCPEDVISVDKTQLTFPETEAGSWTMPEELCLDSDYKSVRRQCLEDSSWGPVIGTCDSSNEISETTNSLWDLQNITNPSETLDKLSNITKTGKNEVKAVDVHLISNILDKIAESAGDGEKFVEIINDIMVFDREILKESQRDLNSTDKILFSLDNFLLNNNQSKIQLSKHNLFANSLEISEDVGGFLVLKGPSVIPLPKDVNYTDVIVSTTNLDFALVLKSHRGTSGYISGFFNSLLFNSENKTEDSVFDNVFSILIPGVELEIYFVLDADVSNNKLACSYWKYGKNHKNLPIFGSWASESQASHVVKDIYRCEFNHTTHFGLLLPNALADNFFLNLITILGSILSIFGIVIIIVSAIMFRSFHEESRNKIILCLALSQMFLIIFIFVSGAVGRGSLCIFIGVVLHYLVLTNFFWMMAVCYFEYLHTQGTQNLNSNAEDEKLFVNFSILSWGFPLLIVVFVLATNYGTYNKSRGGINELCYPKDMYFHMSILLPMSLIMIVNLVLYGLIIKQSLVSVNFLLNSAKRNASNSQRDGAKERVKTIKKSVFLMFFIFGLTWIFGLVGAFATNVIVSEIFSYLFCVVVVFQGFAVFIHYVYETKKFRASWKITLEKVSSTFSGKSKKSQQRPSDTSSVSES